MCIRDSVKENLNQQQLLLKIGGLTHLETMEQENVMDTY